MDGTVLIVGSQGQDGWYLSDAFAKEGRLTVGLDRGHAQRSDGRPMQTRDIMDEGEPENLIAKLQPAEVYYLAAAHASSERRDDAEENLLERSWALHARAPAALLEAIARRSPQTRFFYAASVLVFGDGGAGLLSEDSPMRPHCIYGITKHAGLGLCEHWRRRGVFACGGVLFQHESPRRPADFLSQRIARGAARIAQGSQERLRIGDLSARVDWGWAPDYTRAMRLMLQQDVPRDYVVATGRAHLVEDFAQVAFARVDLDWRDWVVEDSALLRGPARGHMIGDPKRLRGIGWRPTVDFEQTVRIMVDAALESS